MKILLTALAYFASLAIIAAIALATAIVFAGPHSDLLPQPLQVVALALAWLAVLVGPILVAVKAWQRLARRQA